VAGELILGGVDRNHFNGSTVLFARTTKDHQWQVSLQRFAVEGYERWNFRRQMQIASTVSSIIVPEMDAHRIHRRFNKDGLIKARKNGRYELIDCARRNELPDLCLWLGGPDSQELRLTPENYIMEVLQRGRTRCISAIAGQDIEGPTGPMWILGTPFLRAFYTIYDLDRGRIGFVPNKE